MIYAYTFDVYDSYVPIYHLLRQRESETECFCGCSDTDFCECIPWYLHKSRNLTTHFSGVLACKCPVTITVSLVLSYHVHSDATLNRV